MNFALFKKTFEDSGCKNVVLRLKEPSNQAKRLTPKNYIFFDETLQYLITMISASVGKWASIGGTIEEGALDVRFIGRALDEDIYFPGILVLWANTLEYPVAELEIDIRPVPKAEKESQTPHIKMRDVGTKTDTVFFLQAFENSRQLIENKFGPGWFDNWPEIFRFAYLIRNALAHDGQWGIQDQKKGRAHYQTEFFRWPRANLTIRMRDENGSKVDEGKPVLDYLSGTDFVVLLIEMNEALRA